MVLRSQILAHKLELPSAEQALPGRAERMASLAVLALLVALAVWLGFAQSRFSPAVLVATSPLPPPASAGRAAGRAFETAAFLDALAGATPAGPVELPTCENLLTPAQVASLMDPGAQGIGDATTLQLLQQSGGRDAGERLPGQSWHTVVQQLPDLGIG